MKYIISLFLSKQENFSVIRSADFRSGSVYKLLAWRFEFHTCAGKAENCWNVCSLEGKRVNATVKVCVKNINTHN